MGTWNTRGLRGSTLEDLINIAIERYEKDGLALIQKIPTPIVPIKIDKENALITKAYFDKKSTVDYIGVVQGIPVCFDAKECAKDTYSLANIHLHQVEFMNKFEAQDGIAFIIIYFTKKNEFYYLSLKDVNEFFEKAKNGGRKSIPYDFFKEEDRIVSAKGVIVNFLPQLQNDLLKRN